MLSTHLRWSLLAACQLANNSQLQFSVVWSASHVTSPYSHSAVVYSTVPEMLTLTVVWSHGCSPTVDNLSNSFLENIDYCICFQHCWWMSYQLFYKVNI